MTIKIITKQYVSTLKTDISSLEFRFKEVDETKNYVLVEINHNDLMSEKNKKTCKIFKLYWTLAYFSFNRNFCRHYEFSSRNKKFLQSLLELKGISQLSRKRRRSMIK